MKILIIGHFGGRNIGDELILLSQMQIFTSFFKDDITFYIYSYDKDFTEVLYSKYGYNVKVIEAMGLRRFFQSFIDQLNKIKDLDFIIVGGGGIIQDVYFSYGIFRYLLPAFIGLYRRIPVYGFSLGVYRFNNYLNKKLFNTFLSSIESISVRDEISFRKCNREFPKFKIDVIPDSVMLFDKSKIEKAIEIDEKYRVIIMLRDFFISYLGTISKNLKNLFQDKNIKLSEVTISIVVFENSEIEKRLASSLKHNLESYGIESIFVFSSIDPLEYLKLFNTANLVVTGRLHGLIPSVVLNKEFICFSYSPKIDSFCEEKNLKYIRIEEFQNDNQINFLDSLNSNFQASSNTNQDENQVYNFLTKISQKIKSNQKNQKKLGIVSFIKIFLIGIYLMMMHIVNKIFNRKRNAE